MTFRPTLKSLVRFAAAASVLLAARLGHASYCTDTDVVTLTATPYATPWGAYDGLACVEEHFLAAGDRRAIFASVYTLTTRRVAESIDANQYTNTAWMRTYQVEFANRYRRALNDYAAGRRAAVPRPWLVAFDAAASGQTVILQDIILGMNAHINFDLAFAIERVGINPSQASKYLDHTAVNTVLAAVSSEIVAALGALYGSNYALLDAALGPIDDIVLAAGMATARQNAWNNAVTLTASPGWYRPVVVAWIDTTATASANVALSASLSPSLLATLRQLEGSQPGSTFCQHFPCN
jgi:hypothetical protein